MRRHLKRYFVALLLVSVSSHADPQAFAFPLPEGFVSLKGDAAAPSQRGVDQSYVDEAKGFDAYAVHVGSDGVDATYTAKVFPGAPPLANLPKFINDAIQSNPELRDVKIVSTRVVDVVGVGSGRIEVENVSDGVRWHQLLFVLPSRDHWAIVKLAAHQDEYPAASRKVEAVVTTVRGIAPPSGQGVSSAKGVTPADEAQGRLGGMVVLAAFAGYFLNKLLRRRRPGSRTTH